MTGSRPDELARDLLAQVLAQPPGIEIVRTWTAAQQFAAANWAAREAMRARGNRNIAPCPRPAHLEAYR